MECLFLTLFLAFFASLQACSEPINVHIQNYDGPIILHKSASNCDNQQRRNHDNCENQQLRCHGNCDYQCLGSCGKYKQNGCYETECTCVSKVNYPSYVYGGSSTTFGTGCCSIADSKPVVYCVCSSYGSNGYQTNCAVSQGYQTYPNYQAMYSSC